MYKLYVQSSRLRVKSLLLIFWRIRHSKWQDLAKFCIAKFGGGSRIRTHVPFRRSGFQDRRLKPLGHPSLISPPVKYF